MSKSEERSTYWHCYCKFHEQSAKGTNSGMKAKHYWKASQTLYRMWLTQ